MVKTHARMAQPVQLLRLINTVANVLRGLMETTAKEVRENNHIHKVYVIIHKVL